MSKSHRVQAILDDELYQRLEVVAEQEGTTISALIRHAVDVTYMQAFRRRKQDEALQALTAMALPVSDWPEMKTEIERGALGG
jgi:metal-responsive CopG/Arc/MetJ family transcriptional regulator